MQTAIPQLFDLGHPMYLCTGIVYNTEEIYSTLDSILTRYLTPYLTPHYPSGADLRTSSQKATAP